jgi:hypothetical protein
MIFMNSQEEERKKRFPYDWYEFYKRIIRKYSLWLIPGVNPTRGKENSFYKDSQEERKRVVMAYMNSTWGE